MKQSGLFDDDKKSIKKVKRKKTVKKPVKRGRPKISDAEKQRKAKSRKYTDRPSQTTGKKPTVRLKNRRRNNKNSGYFPNPIFYRLYAARTGDDSNKYYFDGVNLDTNKRNAVLMDKKRAEVLAREIIKKVPSGYNIYLDTEKKK